MPQTRSFSLRVGAQPNPSIEFCRNNDRHTSPVSDMLGCHSFVVHLTFGGYKKWIFLKRLLKQRVHYQNWDLPPSNNLQNWQTYNHIILLWDSYCEFEFSTLPKSLVWWYEFRKIKICFLSRSQKFNLPGVMVKVNSDKTFGSLKTTLNDEIQLAKHCLGIIIRKRLLFTLHTFLSISCSISCTSLISSRSRTEILFDVSGLDVEPSFFNFLVNVIIAILIIKTIFVVCLLSWTKFFFVIASDSTDVCFNVSV